MAAPSCKAASGVRATYSTNFGCAPSGQLEQPVMFAIARAGTPLLFDGEEPKDANTCTPSAEGSDALIGDLLVRRNPDYNGPYDLVAIVGLGGAKTKEACNVDADGSPKGVLGGVSCVVARRKFRIIEGRELAQSVLLSAKCAGVICSNGASCNPSTGLCAELEENSTKLTGGGDKTPEVEGGTPPDLDAGKDATTGTKDGSIVDATLDVSTGDAASPYPPCAPSTEKCKASTSFGFATPTIAAGFGQVAWIDNNVVHEVTAASGTVKNISPPEMGAIPRTVAFTSHPSLGNVPVLVLAYRPQVGPDRLAYMRLDQTSWTVVQIPETVVRPIHSLVGDATVLGGLWTVAPGRYVPFIFDDSPTGYSETSSTEGTIGAEPAADQGRFLYAHQTTAHIVTPKRSANIGNVTADPTALPVPIGPTMPMVAELLAGAVNDYYFVGTDRSLYWAHNGFSGRSSDLLVENVVSAVADALNIYLVQSVVNAPPRLLALSRRDRVTCTLPSTEYLDNLAVDNACVYAVKVLPPGQLSGQRALRAFGKVPPP